MTLQTKVSDMNGVKKTDHEGAAFYKPLKRSLELSKPRDIVLFPQSFNPRWESPQVPVICHRFMDY